jgi:hypothetical protein
MGRQEYYHDEQALSPNSMSRPCSLRYAARRAGCCWLMNIASPLCEFEGSPHATNTARSWSPATCPSGAGGETFSDDVVAAAMIDRLVHHAEVLTLTGDSYGTRQRRELLAKQNRADRG